MNDNKTKCKCRIQQLSDIPIDIVDALNLDLLRLMDFTQFKIKMQRMTDRGVMASEKNQQRKSEREKTFSLSN